MNEMTDKSVGIGWLGRLARRVAAWVHVAPEAPSAGRQAASRESARPGVRVAPRRGQGRTIVFLEIP
jgi:hypothetical protein